MVKVSSKTKTFAKEEEDPITSSFQRYDLPALVKEIKKSNAFEKGELNSMTLLKSREKQIVLTALHEGTEIDSFQANDSITFQIIEGRLIFYAKKESVTLEIGQMMTVHENVKYSLTSREDTVFLLTISSSA